MRRPRRRAPGRAARRCRRGRSDRSAVVTEPVRSGRDPRRRRLVVDRAGGVLDRVQRDDVVVHLVDDRRRHLDRGRAARRPRSARRSRGRRRRPCRRRARTRWRRRRTPGAASRPAAGRSRRSSRAQVRPRRSGRWGRGRRSTSGRWRRRGRSRDSTRARPRPSSQSATRSISSAILARSPGVDRSRRSRAPAGRRPRRWAAGRRRRGRRAEPLAPRAPTAAASSASGTGQQHDLVDRRVLPRDARATVTAQRQPR